MLTVQPFSNFFRSRMGAVFIGMLVGSGLWLSGCASGQLDSQDRLTGSQPAGRISIMAYNVENLFDATHDEAREDYTFLPLEEKKRNPAARAYCDKQKGHYREECWSLNWDEAAVQKKLKAVSEGILQVYGKGPDILILEEVENWGILKRLNDEGLQAAGYQTVVLLEGEDIRGIDVGFLSRFPLAGQPKLHLIQFTPRPDGTKRFGTRGILEVPVKLPDGKTLSVFGVHFNSQSNPHQDRVDAVNTLVGILKKKKADDLWVVGGDWNITNREDQGSGLISKTMAELGSVSHITGCKNCSGTHNYRGDWSFLDILVFSKSFDLPTASYRLIPESIWTPKAARLQTLNGRPARFNLTEPLGISDHLPIFAEIQQQETPAKK